MRTKFPIQRWCRIYLFIGPKLGNGYVGIEMNSKTDAWRKRYNGSSKVLKRLIEEYGRARFIKKILREFPFENRFKNGKIESYYIHKYNTLAPNGINRYDPGRAPGFNNSGITFSEEVRKKVSLNNCMHRPEVKQKVIEAWKDPVIRERMIEGIKKAQSSSEYREKQRNIQKEVWNRPEVKENHNKIMNSPEIKEKMYNGMHTIEYIEKQRKKHTTNKCEYCGRLFNLYHYTKHHGDNCKYKPKMKRTS